MSKQSCSFDTTTLTFSIFSRKSARILKTRSPPESLVVSSRKFDKCEFVKSRDFDLSRVRYLLLSTHHQTLHNELTFLITDDSFSFSLFSIKSCISFRFSSSIIAQLEDQCWIDEVSVRWAAQPIVWLFAAVSTTILRASVFSESCSTHKICKRKTKVKWFGSWLKGARCV